MYSCSRQCVEGKPTVNPSSSEYVGSNPTTPTLYSEGDFDLNCQRPLHPHLRKFYALDCSKLQQCHYSTPLFHSLSLFAVKHVKQVKRARKNLLHLKNRQVKQVLQIYHKLHYFNLEVRKNCVIGKYQPSEIVFKEQKSDQSQGIYNLLCQSFPICARLICLIRRKYGQHTRI